MLAVSMRTPTVRECRDCFAKFESVRATFCRDCTRARHERNKQRANKKLHAKRKAESKTIMCPKCVRRVDRAIFEAHSAACTGFRHTLGHRNCPHHPGRVFPVGARGCWLCESRTEDMAELDALIAAGIGTPRAKLTDRQRKAAGI